MDIIQTLTNVEEEYKNKPTFTGEIIIPKLAQECRYEIEALRAENESLRCCGNCNCWEYKYQECNHPDQLQNEIVMKCSIDSCNLWEMAIEFMDK